MRTRTYWTVMASAEYDAVGQTFAQFRNAMRVAKRLAAVGWTVTLVQSCYSA